MSPICSSILFPILLVLFCDAYPAIDSEETNGEKLERFLDRYEELRSDKLDVYSKGGSLPNLIKEAWSRSGTKSKKEFGYDYTMDKRAPSKGKYNYYKCYFNPVTCYGK